MHTYTRARIHACTHTHAQTHTHSIFTQHVPHISECGCSEAAHLALGRRRLSAHRGRCGVRAVSEAPPLEYSSLPSSAEKTAAVDPQQCVTVSKTMSYYTYNLYMPHYTFIYAPLVVFLWIWRYGDERRSDSESVWLPFSLQRHGS